MKIDLLNYDPEAMRELFGERGIDKYRADQVVEWIYRRGVYSFDKMVNLPASLRASLMSEFAINVGEIVQKSGSREDDSVKLLVRFGDGEMAETVYIPRKLRRTVCVSSQVGCKFGCVFCASGQAGFARNLTSGEIVAQVLHARDVSDTKDISHIVFMGMGEPFDNYGEVLAAIRRLNDPKCFEIGARKITVSTSGLVPKIDSFSEKGIQVELSVSLHGANDEVRGKLMPVNRRWPVKELIESCKNYVDKTNRVITFEYLLAKGLNASISDAKELAMLLREVHCKVNLIPLNPIPEFEYKRPTYPEIKAFQDVLVRNEVPATVRFSRGNEIAAACGQLRRMAKGSCAPMPSRKK
ncbi:MAG: 23S rRNA (adenine(2503)-C(2))-methyltransferase RlmN [Candidatus Omnitrophica bacterium]|jgi:23S rRNA (adenine2503-C2)-methyltransferase|nr:23S rRNA (adenine(2503)-C(2))-methyltransferase RlmN [Candidatus Omnitrophota bacterium]